MIGDRLELVFTARLDKDYEQKLREAAEKLRQDIGRPVDIKDRNLLLPGAIIAIFCYGCQPNIYP
jgi:hypothetical protein